MEPYAQDGTAFVAPPIMNPPPQMFGDYGSESPLQYSGNYFPDNDGQGGMEDNGDPKRRRIARACDMCRKKKIKCDGKMPKCSHCINYKTDCIFTHQEKKRNPPKGAKYIEGLENRLGRMESLLKLSGLLSADDGHTDLGTLEKRLADKAAANNHSEQARPSTGDAKAESGGQSDVASQNGTATETQSQSHTETSRDQEQSKRSSVSSPKAQKQADQEVEHVAELMCSLVTNNYGETRFIGSSSGFSIFSPKGIQWVNEKTGDNSFQTMMTESSYDEGNSPWSPWKPEIFGDIFSRRVFRPLPPLNEALSLLKDYFDNFNCMFPLFHEPTFMHLVNRQYSRDPYDGSGWWASLNCALAIAHRLRVMSNLVPQEEDQKAWGFMKNALGVLTELTMRNTDLLSVQALLGMALFLLGTQNPQPSFLLVAAATRLAHAIGLHKNGTTFNLNPVEIEQRKRVFWIAFLLDKDMSLRSGRPPTQDDDDMNVELPSEDPGDNIGNIPLADGKGKLNLFRLMCVFSQIGGKVYKRLYSTKATKTSDGELLNAIGELDKELEDWKDAIPIDFRPEHEIKASHTPLMLHVVVLHFAYYNCLTTIHRMSVHHGYWSNRLSNYAIQGLNARPLNPRVFSSANICVQAARATIQLLKYIPQGDFPCVWMIIYYPVSALMTLFTNVLQNPQDARTRPDIRLMHQVVSFLSSIAVEEETGGVKRMLEVCVEFERIAKVVVDKADKDSHSRRKRKAKDSDDEDNNATNHTPKPFSSTTPAADKASNKGTPAATPLNQAHTPKSAHTPAASTTANGLTPFSPPSFTQPFSPSTMNGFSSPGPSGEMLPNYVPPPGDFPNMFTADSFPDFSQFGAGGVGSPGMSNLQQYLSSGQDLWQMPMGDWDQQWGSGMGQGENSNGVGVQGAFGTTTPGGEAKRI